MIRFFLSAISKTSCHARGFRVLSVGRFIGGSAGIQNLNPTDTRIDLARGSVQTRTGFPARPTAGWRLKIRRNDIPFWIWNIVLLLAVIGCKANKQTDVAQDESLIKGEIQEFHRNLKKAYNGGGVNTDSLYDTYFDRDSYYVTAWGISEPIDSTKKRLRSAILHIKDYEYRVEIMSTKVMGNGGYVFFVLRQSYRNDGTLVEEYLPTTFVMERREEAWVVIHAQRSTDYETMQQWVQLQKMREEQDKKAK